MRKVIIIFVITVGSGLLYVRGQQELICMSYQIKSEEKQLKELISLNRSLEYELASLESPAILEERFASISSKNTHLASWKVAGVVKTRGTGVSRPPTLVASVRTQKNIWGKFFRGVVAEARASSVKIADNRL